MRLRPHAGREIVQDAPTLVRGHLQAIARHILEHPGPTVPRTPDRAIEIAESVTLATDLGDELPVGPFWHARVDLLCGRHLNARHNGNDASQQTRGFHSRAPFLRHDILCHDILCHDGGNKGSTSQSLRRWGNAMPRSVDAPEFMRIMAALRPAGKTAATTESDHW